MAHSVIDFGDNNAVMHDSDVVATVAYMLRFAEAQPDRFPDAAHPCLAVWRDMLSFYSPGCLDLQLTETLLTEADIRNFTDLAQVTRAALAAEPEVITGDRLNTMTGFGEDDLTFGDRPRDKMLADLDRIVAVVQPGP